MQGIDGNLDAVAKIWKTLALSIFQVIGYRWLVSTVVTTTCGSNWSLFVDTLVNIHRLGLTLFFFYSLLLVTLIFDACSYQ